MQLLPIDFEESKNIPFKTNPECVDVLSIYPDYYRKVGYNKPWIGYFATLDGKEIIGCGGFKGEPKDGKVEVAYGTFKNYEGQGIGTQICRQLVLISLQSDPSVRITARTLMENNASTRILKKNGFEFNGVVFDEDDGDVWEWELKETNL